jgi:hypothetical protein
VYENISINRSYKYKQQALLIIYYDEYCPYMIRYDINKKKREVRVTGVDTGGKGGKREEGLEVSGRVNGGRALVSLKFAKVYLIERNKLIRFPVKMLLYISP